MRVNKMTKKIKKDSYFRSKNNDVTSPATSRSSVGKGFGTARLQCPKRSAEILALAGWPINGAVPETRSKALLDLPLGHLSSVIHINNDDDIQRHVPRLVVRKEMRWGVQEIKNTEINYCKRLI